MRSEYAIRLDAIRKSAKHHDIGELPWFPPQGFHDEFLGRLFESGLKELEMRWFRDYRAWRVSTLSGGVFAELGDVNDEIRLVAKMDLGGAPTDAGCASLRASLAPDVAFRVKGGQILVEMLLTRASVSRAPLAAALETIDRARRQAHEVPCRAADTPNEASVEIPDRLDCIDHVAPEPPSELDILIHASREHHEHMLSGHTPASDPQRRIVEGALTALQVPWELDKQEDWSVHTDLGRVWLWLNDGELHLDMWLRDVGTADRSLCARLLRHHCDRGIARFVLTSRDDGSNVLWAEAQIPVDLAPALLADALVGVIVLAGALIEPAFESTHPSLSDVVRPLPSEPRPSLAAAFPFGGRIIDL